MYRDSPNVGSLMFNWGKYIDLLYTNNKNDSFCRTVMLAHGSTFSNKFYLEVYIFVSCSLLHQIHNITTLGLLM